MTRRILSLLLSLVLLCAMLGAAAQEQEPVTLRFTFWGSAAEKNAIEALAASFHEAYPYITVETQHIPSDYEAKMSAMVAGNEEPDLGYVRDFIDYTFLKTFFNIQNFGVGNIADIFVLVGLLCLVVYVFFGYKEGDFAKDGGHTDVDPDVLVVNEGEEQKKERVAEKDNVVSDAVNTDEAESVSRVNTEGSGDCGKTSAADVSAAHKNTQEKAR